MKKLISTQHSPIQDTRIRDSCFLSSKQIHEFAHALRLGLKYLGSCNSYN